MKSEDWTVLGDYIRDRANELRLSDWYLVLKEQPPEDVYALASCEPVEGRKHALIRVCAEFRELTRDEQRQVIVHELLHCHLAHVQYLTGLGSQLHKMFGVSGLAAVESVRMALEYSVDGIADAIAGNYPLIAWMTPDPAPEDMVNAPYVGRIDSRPAELTDA